MTQRNVIQPYFHFLNELIIHVVGTRKYIHPLQDSRTRIEDIDRETKRIDSCYDKRRIVLLAKPNHLTVEQVVKDSSGRSFDLYLGRKRILQDAQVGMTITKFASSIVIKPEKHWEMAKRKKTRLDILYIVSNTMIGGAEKQLLRLVQTIDKETYSVHVLIPHIKNKGRLHNEFEKACTLHSLASAGPGNWKAKLVTFINDHNFDVVHLINFQELYELVLQFKPSIRVVATIFMEVEKQKRSFWWQQLSSDPRIESRVDLWITDSEANKRCFPRFEVVPTGVPDYFKPEAKEPKSVAWVSRLSPEKRIESVLQIARDLPGYKFYMIVAVNKRVIQSSLNVFKTKPPNVTLYQNLKSSEVAKILAKCEFFLLTSKTESMNVGVMEAMMSGCVPICTSVGNIPNIIENSVNGYLIPRAANPHTYVVEHISSFESTLGAAARETALNLWNMKVRTKNHEFLYGRIGKRDETRIVFIRVYPRLDTKFWEMKKDSMQHSIRKLGENFNVLMLAPHRQGSCKRKIINGCNTIFYQHGNRQQIFNILDEFQPHVIVLNCLHTKIHGDIIKRYPNAYKAIYEYGGKLKWDLLKRFDRIFVQQEYRGKECIAVNDLNPEKVVVAPFCVDASKFRPMRLKKKWNAVMIADFRPNIKRQHLLIEAWKNIPGRLLLLGRLNEQPPYGSYEKKCRALTKRLGIANRVDFKDFVPHSKLAEILNRCKIGVLTSSREGGSRVQLEKMACGLPMVVMEDCLGARGFMRANEGLRVEPTPEKIAEAINHLLRNEKLRKQMGERGSNRVRRDMSYRSMYEKFLKTAQDARPEITVITTSLNKGKFIKKCVDSVDKQRKKNRVKINHVIIDGGSLDQTHNVLHQCGAKVKVFIKTGMSQTESLNYAMEIVNRDYPMTRFIGWLNADDWYEDEWLSESLKRMDRVMAGKQVDMTCGAYNLRDEEGRMLKSKVDPGATQIPDNIDIRQLQGYNTINQPTVLIRRRSFEELKKETGHYWNPSFEFTQDYELWLRMVKAGFLLLRIRKALANLRNYPEQLSHTHFNEQKKEFDLVQKMIN